MKRFYVLSVLCMALLASCKKSAEKPAEGIVGQWQWIGSVDGFLNFSTPASTGNNKTLVFAPDSSYSSLVNNSITESGTFHISPRTDAPADGFDKIVTFQPSYAKGASTPHYYSIKNDTLTTVNTFLWEATTSHYVRKK